MRGGESVRGGRVGVAAEWAWRERGPGEGRGAGRGETAAGGDADCVEVTIEGAEERVEGVASSVDDGDM